MIAMLVGPLDAASFGDLILHCQSEFSTRQHKEATLAQIKYRLPRWFYSRLVLVVCGCVVSFRQSDS